jgi:hypothetical protein
MDANDSFPLRTDTAVINISHGFEYEASPGALREIIKYVDYNQTSLGGNDTVISFTNYVRVQNTGTDYTSYLNFSFRIYRWCAPGIDVQRQPVVSRYFPPYNSSINKTINDTWIAQRQGLEDVNSSGYWALKSYKAGFGRLEAGERRMTIDRFNLTFGDMNRTTMQAVLSPGRCTYNFTVVDTRYERF